MRRSFLLLLGFFWTQTCSSRDSNGIKKYGKHDGKRDEPVLFPSTPRSHARVRHDENDCNCFSRGADSHSPLWPRTAGFALCLRGGKELLSKPSPPAVQHLASSPPAPTPTSAVSTRDSVSPKSDADRRGIVDTARVLGYFLLWYALNVWYNIVNKRVLNALDLPVSIAILQLGIGSLWVTTQWVLGVRTRPGELTSSGLGRLTPVAFFHGGGQLATVLSLGAGAVSFTHVVKAVEPFFSALVAAVWFGQVFRWQVYASLLPVVAGVALACAKEINFSWLSFLAAMASNLLFACRSNFSKALMARPLTQGGGSMSSANLYGLVTLTAFGIFAPVAAFAGWGKWRAAWDLAMRKGYREKALAFSVLLSGISHYLNNEVMYLALGSVHPTTLAVGNTMKRVFIVVASLIVFKTPMTGMGMVGSAIGIGGVLVYSLTKQHFDALERKKASQSSND